MNEWQPIDEGLVEALVRAGYRVYARLANRPAPMPDDDSLDWLIRAEFLLMRAEIEKTQVKR